MFFFHEIFFAFKYMSYETVHLPKFSPDGIIILQKNSFITHILFAYFDI